MCSLQTWNENVSSFQTFQVLTGSAGMWVNHHVNKWDVDAHVAVRGVLTKGNPTGRSLRASPGGRGLPGRLGRGARTKCPSSTQEGFSAPSLVQIHPPEWLQLRAGSRPEAHSSLGTPRNLICKLILKINPLAVECMLVFFSVSIGLVNEHHWKVTRRR